MYKSFYFGRSKNIEDESMNEYLESNRKKFNDLMGQIGFHVRVKQPKSELSKRYHKRNVSFYESKFKKDRANSISYDGLVELIDFFSYLLNKEIPKYNNNPIELMYELMNECYQNYYEDFKQGNFGQVIDDSLVDNIILDLEAELIEEGHGIEGAVKHYYGKRYERDSRNRVLAIKKHGLNCYACGFNFEKLYGQRGKDFIEVHHIKPLSTLEEAVEVNPETDLVPLCANCHRMVHRSKDNVLSFEELKQLILEHKKL